MWKGIVSDLKTVVDTITNDTTKVFGENENEGEGDHSNQKTKILLDLRRSFNTYASPIEEEYVTEFGNFMTKFTVEARCSEIKTLLDDEADISRNYAELVPHKVTPLQFWGRYFFRVHLLENDGVLGLDEVVEEEGNWDDAALSNTQEDTIDNTSGGIVDDNLNLCKKNLASCLQENSTLKGHIRALTSRVRELEAILEKAKEMGFDPNGQRSSPSSALSSQGEPGEGALTGTVEEEMPKASSEDSKIEPLSASQVVADLGDSEGEEGWGSDEN